MHGSSPKIHRRASGSTAEGRKSAQILIPSPYSLPEGALHNKKGTNHKRHNEDHKKAQETLGKTLLCFFGCGFVPFVYCPRFVGQSPQREKVKTKCGAETISINRAFPPAGANITAPSCGSLAGMRGLRFST